MDTIMMEAVSKKAAELGYTVVFEEESLQGIFPTMRTGYTPDVFGGYSFTGEPVPYTVMTTSYGTVPSEELDAVIEGLRRGQEMANTLNAFLGLK